MSSIPKITGREAIRAFEKAGFKVVRISGSHHIMKRDGNPFLLSIPVHRGKTIGSGLLKSQIAAAGLTADEFIALLA
jgi:predicted RNA binding protein YcfA (HicA-like mRNA interferase family)